MKNQLFRYKLIAKLLTFLFVIVSTSTQGRAQDNPLVDNVLSIFENKVIPKLSEDKNIDVKINFGSDIYGYYVVMAEKSINLAANRYLSYPNAPIEALVYTICHELGHFYGNENLKFDDGVIFEGEAEYFAGRVCLPLFLKASNIELSFVESERESFKRSVSTICTKSHSNSHDIDICSKSIIITKAFVEAFVKGLTTENEHNIDFDNLATLNFLPEVSETYGFHSTLACRFKTALNGASGLQRPACWFAGRLEVDDQ